MSIMTPQEIVNELDKFIIGQESAKRAVAIALRNRWRRMQVPLDLRNEITPKNILMIGPTGVGKTEIARRLAAMADAPFIKVEATKFTEVGYVGRDVESIIRDLLDISFNMLKEQAIKNVQEKALDAAENRILDVLLPQARQNMDEHTSQQNNTTHQIFRKKLREGELDDKEIEVKVRDTKIGVEIMAPPGMEEMTNQLQGLFSSMNNQRVKSRKLKVKHAFKLLKEEEADKLINEDELKVKALSTVEQNGIVFIDEIDKIVQEQARRGEVSREGVQRDLLPLIEGCTVNTKYGMLKTDHILFIASGAFHLSNPSDLVPELQGRLPIRVELQALSIEDFQKILTEPDFSLTKQYCVLMKTENVDIEFSKTGIQRIAEIAWQVNDTTENIGARRLHTVMEKLLESVSFSASELANNKEPIVITEQYVNEKLDDLARNEDLSRFIL